jgi:PST family polysaccharide transporter
MPAMFASVGSDVAALRRYFLMLTEGLANVLFPATIGVALVAPEFVQLVLGPKWAGAIVPLQLLCFYTGFHMLATLLAPVLHVRGEVRFATRNGLYTLFILPPAFYFFGTRWGTAGIASVWLVVYPLILVPMYAKVFRVLSVSPTAYLRALWPSLSSSMVMVAAVLAVRVALGDWGSVGERLALEVATGVLSYGGLVLLLHRERLYAMINFLKAARK